MEQELSGLTFAYLELYVLFGQVESFADAPAVNNTCVKCLCELNRRLVKDALRLLNADDVTCAALLESRHHEFRHAGRHEDDLRFVHVLSQELKKVALRNRLSLPFAVFKEKEVFAVRINATIVSSFA